MTDLPPSDPAERPGPPPGLARAAMLRRLVDTVALPSNLIPLHERALAGDILLDMLFQLGDEERALCVERLKHTVDAPRRLMRYLAQCRIEVARPLLADNRSFDASDLVDLVRTTTPEHRMAIAARRPLGECEADALIEAGEARVMRVLLGNPGAKLSETGIDGIVALSQQAGDLCDLLVRRPELTASQALAMFWWCSAPTRKLILTKYPADRMVLVDRCSDVFALMTQEGWADPVARKAVQMVERRQRNRAALERSAFGSLEEAISHAAEAGMSPEILEEIGYLSGLKPLCVAKLVSDIGGEGLAVLCKATGLRRDSLAKLWRALRRPAEAPDGSEYPLLAYVTEVYDTLSVNRAQTALRYWNWSLTSSGRDGRADNDAGQEDSFSASRRTTRLVFGR